MQDVKDCAFIKFRWSQLTTCGLWLRIVRYRIVQLSQGSRVQYLPPPVHMLKSTRTTDPCILLLCQQQNAWTLVWWRGSLSAPIVHQTRAIGTTKTNCTSGNNWVRHCTWHTNIFFSFEQDTERQGKPAQLHNNRFLLTAVVASVIWLSGRDFCSHTAWPPLASLCKNPDTFQGVIFTNYYFWDEVTLFTEHISPPGLQMWSLKQISGTR